MAAPKTAVGLRRKRILDVLLRARSPLSTAHLAMRVGWTTRTVLDHLHWMQAAGCVSRHNWRRWSIASGFDASGFDASTLDGV